MSRKFILFLLHIMMQNTTNADVVAVAYREGHFNAGALIVKAEYTLTAKDKDDLRTRNIILSDELQEDLKMAYNLDYTQTAVLLAAYEQKKKPTTFLKSRYFFNLSISLVFSPAFKYKNPRYSK